MAELTGRGQSLWSECAMCRVPVLPPPPHRPHHHVHRLLGPAPAAPPPARTAPVRVRADLSGQVAGLSCRRNFGNVSTIFREGPSHLSWKASPSAFALENPSRHYAERAFKDSKSTPESVQHESISRHFQPG